MGKRFTTRAFAAAEAAIETAAGHPAYALFAPRWHGDLRPFVVVPKR